MVRESKRAKREGHRLEPEVDWGANTCSVYEATDDDPDYDKGHEITQPGKCLYCDREAYYECTSCGGRFCGWHEAQHRVTCGDDKLQF
jgi:hypothetical protein